MAREKWWSNSDSLYVGYGTRTAEKSNVAKASTQSPFQVSELIIKFSDIPDATLADVHKVYNQKFPAGTTIVRATLTVHTAFTSGGSAVLDIGTYGTDDWLAIDDDGVDAAIAVATLVDNYSVVCDGAQIGATLTEEFVVAATYDTAAFTAGEAVLRIEYLLAQG